LQLFALCRSTDWHALPTAGGWLDQPDWFVHDMFIIGQRLGHLRRKKDRGRAAQERLRKAARRR